MDSPQDALPETEGAPHLLGGDLHRVHRRRDEGVAEADEHAAQVQLVHPRRPGACHPREEVGEARGEQDRLGPDDLGHNSNEKVWSVFFSLKHCSRIDIHQFLFCCMCERLLF